MIEVVRDSSTFMFSPQPSRTGSPKKNFQDSNFELMELRPGSASPEITATTAGKPPRSPGRVSLARSAFPKPKSRFEEPTYSNEVKDTEETPQRKSPNVGSPSHRATATTPRSVPITPRFEFIYLLNWVGDQTLLYRRAEKREFERSLDPPPLNINSKSGDGIGRRRNVNEPIVAFGPPGTTGELNVSVIVSPVSLDFKIEAFGGPKEVGEAVVRTITGAGKRPDVKGTLVKSNLREDSLRNVKYYELEFRGDQFWFDSDDSVCIFQEEGFAVAGRLG